MDWRLWQGHFLDDVQRLDLHAMAWAPPPLVGGRMPRAQQRAAGHSLVGLLVFGGCMPTPHGILPVARTDLLLLGARPVSHMCRTTTSLCVCILSE